ncbi:MAG: hypothetical protein J0I36_15470, partial [Pandoraea sp.]|nr:hypothetical protein [Pandoraea sp.]
VTDGDGRARLVPRGLQAAANHQSRKSVILEPEHNDNTQAVGDPLSVYPNRGGDWGLWVAGVA